MIACQRKIAPIAQLLKEFGTKNSDLFLRFLKNHLISGYYRISTLFAYLDADDREEFGDQSDYYCEF